MSKFRKLYKNICKFTLYKNRYKLFACVKKQLCAIIQFCSFIVLKKCGIDAQQRRAYQHYRAKRDWEKHSDKNMRRLNSPWRRGGYFAVKYFYWIPEPIYRNRPQPDNKGFSKNGISPIISGWNWNDIHIKCVYAFLTANPSIKMNFPPD